MRQLGIIAPALTAPSGWSAYTLNLLRALDSWDCAITVLVPRDTPIQVDGLPKLRIHAVLPAVEPRERYLLAKQVALVPTVRRLLRDCDVVHVTAELYAPLGALAAGRKPLIVTGHGSYVLYPAQRKFPAATVYRWAYGRAHFVCVSRYTANTLRALIPNARISVVNNGVDAGRYAAIWAAQQSRTVAKRGRLVVSLGALKPRKGTLALVRALAVVRQRLPDVRGVIIGDLLMEPAYVAQVRAEIAALGLSDVVQLTGRLPDGEVQRWLAEADVFVLPSINDGWKFEGFGLAHLEASAAGLPVVSTRGNGVEDAVEDGVSGILVSQDRVAEELPAALLKLLENPHHAQTMGAAGHAKAQALSWTRTAAQTMQVYHAVLGQR